MRIRSILSFCMLLLAVLVIALSGSAMGQIAGSKHDFTSAGPNAGTDLGYTTPCLACHVPHPKPLGATALTGELLWNRPDQQVVSAGAYTEYSSSTLSVGNAGLQPGLVSRMCLSCHDGTIALDESGGSTNAVGVIGGITPTDAGVVLNLTRDLSNDHPVGVSLSVADVAKAGQYNDPPIAAVKLFAGNVECASCHDPHGPAGSGAAGGGKFLRVTADSLCQACHVK